jgi:hypothetical protein
MKAGWIVAWVLATGCAKQHDNFGQIESAIEEDEPVDQVPPPPDAPGAPDAAEPDPCEAGEEYDSYYCCMQSIGDQAYCAAMNPEPPIDLGEAAPAQTGGTIAVPDNSSPPPPSTGPGPEQVTLNCEEDPASCE